MKGLLDFVRQATRTPDPKRSLRIVGAKFKPNATMVRDGSGNLVKHQYAPHMGKVDNRGFERAQDLSQKIEGRFRSGQASVKTTLPMQKMWPKASPANRKILEKHYKIARSQGYSHEGAMRSAELQAQGEINLGRGGYGGSSD